MSKRRNIRSVDKVTAPDYEFLPVMSVQGQRSPVTAYFLWPHADAWEELKECLDGKPWVSERWELSWRASAIGVCFSRG